MYRKEEKEAEEEEEEEEKKKKKNTYSLCFAIKKTTKKQKAKQTHFQRVLSENM